MNAPSSEQRGYARLRRWCLFAVHYGPVYGNKLEPFGHSLAACRPGPQPGNLTTHKPWVNCESCKKTEAYRYGK